MNKWLTTFVVLLVIYAAASLFAFFTVGNEDGFADKIAVVPLEGVIVTTDSTDTFLSGGVVSSGAFVEELKLLDSDAKVKGIIIEIDSPGGTAVASKEIADAIKNLNKTNYAVIRGVGASGAYWAASASDKIFASSLSITGSIGVIASYLQFSELFEKYGIEYERLVAGEKKDLGSPFRDLDKKEREILQKKLDLMHEIFIQEVAENRGLNVSYVNELADGEFYLGQEALGLGLVDVLGNREDAVEMMKEELGIDDLTVVEKKRKVSLANILLGKMAYNFGAGFAKGISEFESENRLEIRA